MLLERNVRDLLARCLIGAIALVASSACTIGNAPRNAAPAGGFAQSFAREAVATDHELASSAGAEMLRLGGNAVDAAVAASFCLSVVRPHSCGIGGGGFMVIHLPDHNGNGHVDTALNYRETCPRGIGPNYYTTLDADASRHGGSSVATPGTVAGLLTALERYGTLDRATVMAPAIRAARDGFPADAAFVRAARDVHVAFDERAELRRRFAFVWERYLLRGALKIGDRIVNPEQARALELIARDGASVFYHGEIARAIVDAVQSDGGALDERDLAEFAVSEVKPLATTYRGRAILTMPPPSSGGLVLAQCFATLEAAMREADLATPWSADFTHLYVEAMKHSFADRARWLADPTFVDLPLAQLLDPAMLRRRAESIDWTHTSVLARYGWPGPSQAATPSTAARRDDAGTSHISVVDAHGGAVACTETVNLEFGSLLAVPGFGFLLNDEMDDFTTRRDASNAFGLRQSDDNVPAYGKRPLSSMMPTIVLDREGRVEAVAGASGGPRIISGTTQALLNVLFFDFSAADAVARQRVHHQWLPDLLRCESGVSAQLMEELAGRGHSIAPIEGVGDVQLIRRARSAAGWEAASDPRKGGSPAGR